jgi:DNA-directed RNA polymerase specialized sigma24 family protein
MSADTVGIAFPRFVTGVLIPGRWDSTAGASLATFFVGQVLYRYPNVHRRWAVQLRRDEQPTSDEHLTHLLPHGRQPRPDDQALDRLEAADRLTRLRTRAPARTFEVAGYRDAGYTWEEVSELTGLSVPAAKSILNRTRQTAHPR